MNNIKVLVYGMGHLGCTTAACLANLGFEVIGLEHNVLTINDLNMGIVPVSEPELNKLIKKGLKKDLKFKFFVNLELLKTIDYLWVTFDTPVDNSDKADKEYVINELNNLMEYVSKKTKIVISSQLPVGTIAKIEKKYPKHTFCCAPENLRHGSAVKVFTKPDRIVIGVRKESDKEKFKPLFERISKNLEWMSIESAEMTKHAINSFLATSIVFINEIAEVCKKVGADSIDVSRGLKTDERIGQKSYLRPGEAYTGGTLGRDIQYLIDLPRSKELFDVIQESNDKQLRKEKKQ